MIEESRILQICVFTALHKTSSQLVFTKVLPDVVTIADEVDAQLKQQTVGFMAANAV